MADRLQWESLLTSVLHELPQPVSQEAVRDGSLILLGGDPGEVVVRLTRTMAAVSEYGIEWDGPEEPVVRPILFGTIQWRRMPEVHALASINTLIRAARESRRAKYVVCRVCERALPPERLFDDETCDECRAS